MRVEKAMYGDLIDRCATGFNLVTETDEAQRAEWYDPGEMRVNPHPGLDPTGEVTLYVLRWGETSLLVGSAPIFSQVGANDNQADLF